MIEYVAKSDPLGTLYEIEKNVELLPGEQVLVDAQIRRRVSWILQPIGWLRMTNNRLFLLTHRFFSRDRIVEIPLNELGEGFELKSGWVSFSHGFSDATKEFRVRPFSFAEILGPAAMGGDLAIGAAAGALANSRPSKIGHLRDALNRGLQAGFTGSMDGAPSTPFARQTTTLTWKHVLFIPGMGAMAILALIGLLIGFRVHAGALAEAQVFESAPVCSDGRTSGCKLISEESVRVSDRSGAPTLLLTGLDGETREARLYTSKDTVDTLRDGQAVTVTSWYGQPALIEAEGWQGRTYDHPAANADNEGATRWIALLFAVPSVPASLYTLKRYLRQEHA